MKIVILIIFAVCLSTVFGDFHLKAIGNTETFVSPTPKKRPTPKKKMKYDRLPPRIRLDTEVRKDILNEKGEIVSFEVVTVEQRLTELKASYKKNILVDGKGREIRFFEPLCRGVSAGYETDERDRLEKERELAELLKKYTVIILYCNPAKVM